MVLDAAGPSFQPQNFEAAEPRYESQNFEEQYPNPNAQHLYDMLQAANEPLYDGCESHSQLSATAKLLNIKADHGLSERCYDSISGFVGEVLPEGNKMPKNFYETKKLVQGLGLPVEVIHCCLNGCMIYWGDDVELLNCKFFGELRYKTIGKSRKAK